MTPLLVQIENTDSGVRVEAGFSRSPVRVGRNQLNDLAIDESFVSQWHGLIRFDDGGVRFLDLGSTNGTVLGGETLAANVEVDLPEDAKLEIGPLQLRCVRMALGKDQILPRRAPAFQLGGTRRAGKGVGTGGTVKLGEAARASIDDFAQTLAMSMSGGEGAPPMAEIRAMAQRQRELLDRVRPLYEAHEAALTSLRAAIDAGLGEAKTPAEREICESLLRDSYPQAFASGGSGALGDGVDVHAWLEVLAPGASAKLGDPDAALRRAGSILEAFASAYLDLRHGQRQVQKDLGIEPGSEAQSLPDFDDSRALLGYLLDGHIDVAYRLDELARAFADFAVHQLGLVNGATEGARSLLTLLSPQGIGAEARAAIVKTSMGLGDVLWPFRAAGNYYRYVSKHLELATGEQFRTYLFGSAFGRAYYRVTGSKS